MTDAERLETLKAKLKARTGKLGFEENVREIQAEIERLETAQKDDK